jgi:hypothetical protein
MDFENFLLGVRNVWDKLQASSPSPDFFWRGNLGFFKLGENFQNDVDVWRFE